MQKNTLIVGTGLTGQSFMAYLKRLNQPFTCYDTRTEIANLTALKKSYPSVTFICGDEKLIDWASIKQVYVSPGIAPHTPVIVQARALAIPIKGDLCVFAENCEDKVIAITGTNGKSTVTSLVVHLLTAAGLKVAMAGNIGLPMLDPPPAEVDVWVLELSSFQLWYQDNFKPTVACILNLSQDHLDWHHTFDNYKTAKHKIYDLAEKKLCNAKDFNTQPVGKTDSETFCATSLPKSHYCLNQGNFCIEQEQVLNVEAFPLEGLHNAENLAAALAIVDSLGIDVRRLSKAVSTFEGLLYRSQVISHRNGVKWVNDSKGTNVGATVAAIEGLGPTLLSKMILIAGGIGKDADFSLLSPAIKKYVKQVYLIGRDKDKIVQILPDSVEYRSFDSLEEATVIADRNTEQGDCVLFSPACASFDMFKNYMHRGEVFTQLVQEL